MTQAFIVYNLLMVLLMCAWSNTLSSNAGRGMAKSISPSGVLAAVFSIIIYTAVLGLRFKVGGDYDSYVDYYNTTTSDVSYKDVSFEFGFYWLIRFLRAFDLPSWTLFIATCAIQIGVLSAWLSRQSDAAPWLVYFYFTTLLGFESLNIIRQAMALMIIMLAISELVERRPWRYCLWILLASTLHVSALVFLPMAVFVHRDWRIDRAGLLLILAGSYAVAGTVKDLLFEMLPIFSLIDGFAGYSSLQDELFFEREVRGVSLGTIFALFVDSLIVYWSPYLLKRYGKNGFRAYFNVFYVGAVLTPVVVAANYITFARLAFYFTSFRFVVLGFLAAWLFSRDAHFPGAKLVASLLISMYFAFFSMAIIRGAAWSAPFQFIFQ